MVKLPEISGYKILKELGKGGMARVYLAIEEKFEREVALKVLLRSLTDEQNLTDRFLIESKTAAGLRHTNIVSIHDVGQAGEDIYYFTMEYLTLSLKDMIKKSGSIEPQEAVKIIKEIGKALDYAHKKGIIHRDIKPDNIMFREDGTSVLVDFGIARAMDAVSKLTKTNMSIGTPHYMSPEQARGKKLDGRSDIYSLGVLFYEMLVGKIPYDSDDSIAVAIQHVQDPIPELPAHLSKYQNIINSLMAKDPMDRPETSKELVDLIDNPKNYKKSIKEQNSKPVSIENHKDKAENTVNIKRNILIKKLSLILAVLVIDLLLIILLNNDKSIVKNIPINKAQPKKAEKKPEIIKPVEEISLKENDNIINVMGVEFVKIPAGLFEMGFKKGDADERKVHSVYLDTYYMAKYEVTFDLYNKFCIDTGKCKLSKRKLSKKNHPIVNITWYEADAFCKWFSKKTGKNVSLPTEAQWEKACKGQIQGKRDNDINLIAWYSENSNDETHPVGQKLANNYGLYDMLGNVWEWCSDSYSKNYYSISPEKNPKGPKSGANKVFRGGSCYNITSDIRSSNRDHKSASDSLFSIGFRLVMNMEK